jgi:hypothetical protein
MAKNLGISDYVKEKLQAITPDVAIPLRVLVKDLVEKFPSVKDETSASVRINSVLKQKTVAEKYGRIRGKDGKTYIVLVALVPAKDAVVEVNTETTTEVFGAAETANFSGVVDQEGTVSAGEGVPSDRGVQEVLP